MAFIHKSGPARAQAFIKTASTAIAVGSVLGFTNSGFVEQQSDSTIMAGVSLRKVSSTSGDYALNSTISVVVPGPADIFEADVTVGTATQAVVGQKHDITSEAGGTAQSVNLNANTYGIVTVVGFISASKVLVKFNGYYVYADVST